MKKQDRYIATKAILNALKDGRQLSQLDCEEFKVEDMRTIPNTRTPTICSSCGSPHLYSTGESNSIG